MFWNYRVMEMTYPDGSVFHEVREVYYTEDKPTGYTENTTAPISEDGIEGLRAVLELYIAACDKPVLTPKDFKK